MSLELSKQYNPREVEDSIYNFWLTKNYFHAEADASKKPYTIVIPPPNVTGILHMGHALNNTIQDILIRAKRMQGFNCLWVPGTDHAGIATQNVVEKKIKKEKNLTRQDLGREKFLEEVWNWRNEYGSTIISQLKKLGSSCDWQRLSFTMDEGYSKSVQEVFITLFNAGLIYRGNYIINWCPRCQTALSDEEAPHKDLDGFLYYIKYPIKDTKNYITVATTRPETMLGDKAIAINPKDKRFKHLIGKTVILPLIEKEIPIIADELVDMEFGTGFVKVTPAHDPNDFIMGKRHNLEPLKIMTPDGKISENSGDYNGMDRFEAREAIIEDLKERKLLEKIEPHKHAVGHCYRCHTIIEPYLSLQWFVKMKPLSEEAVRVVKSGKIKFHPARWKKIYLNWFNNLQDWCISRQIWWGHRIPVYYCKKCQETGILNEKIKNQNSKIEQRGVIVSKTKSDKCPNCGSSDIYQDEDVLDTWFSSWLWPFATLNWPKEQSEKELKYFYPTNTLVTAQEIIFFWVARMIMAGIYFMKDIPFRDVYIHGTVRDDTGKKMSKSLGNIIDPLEIINNFGADALRFSIISLTSAGQDVYLSNEKFQAGRNFANKIWNASRFVLINLEPEKINVDLCIYSKDNLKELKDRWILSRFYQTLAQVSKSIDQFKINEAIKQIYEFFWHEFCDWYIELSKQDIKNPTTQVILYKVLEKTLRILHPFMPFITEQIWQSLSGEKSESIMIASWPHLQKQFISKEIDSQMQVIIDLIASVRNLRAEIKIDPSKTIDLIIYSKNKDIIKLLKENSGYIQKLGQVLNITFQEKEARPKNAVSAVSGKISFHIPLEGIIDIGKELLRVNKEIENIENFLKNSSTKLNNKDFLKNAPLEVIEKEKQKRIDLKEKLEKLKTYSKFLS
ncbi:MAG: valine--tRNA ligase [Candidatus Omnitrophota bacterium]